MASVIRENTGDLTAKVTVKLAKEDYLPAFEKKLKEYSKTANIPGFRKGHVPAGMIKKMYGPGIFSDEVLRTVEKELYTYLDKERPDIFAQPLPLEGEMQKLSMETPGDFDFSFEMGLKPAVELPDFSKTNLKKYQVEISDAELDKEIELMRKRPKADEQSSKEEEQDEEGEKEQVQEEEGKAVEGQKEDANKETAEKEDAPLAEMNEDFFERVFPGKDIKDETAFRAALKEEMEKFWVAQSRNQLHDQIYHLLIDETKMEFPQAFLTRWLKTGGDKQRTAEEAEKEYPGFESQLKWTLISDKLLNENKIEVKEEEIRANMQKELMQYFGQMPAGSDMSWLDAYLDRMMKDEKQVDAAYRKLSMEKLFTAVEEKISTKDEKIDAEAFKKLQHHHH